MPAGVLTVIRTFLTEPAGITTGFSEKVMNLVENASLSSSIDILPSVVFVFARSKFKESALLVPFVKMTSR